MSKKALRWILVIVVLFGAFVGSYYYLLHQTTQGVDFSDEKNQKRDFIKRKKN